MAFKNLGKNLAEKAKSVGEQAKEQLEGKLENWDIDTSRFILDFSGISQTLNEFGMNGVLDKISGDPILASIAAVVYTFAAEGIDKIKQEMGSRMVVFNNRLASQMESHPERVGFWDGFLSVYTESSLERDTSPHYLAFSQVGRVFGFLISPVVPAPVSMMISKINQFSALDQPASYFKSFVEQKIGVSLGQNLLTKIDDIKEARLGTAQEPPVNQENHDISSGGSATDLKEKYQLLWNKHYAGLSEAAIMDKQLVEGVPSELKEILVQISNTKLSQS